MAYMYIRNLVAGYGPYSHEDFYNSGLQRWIDFDAAFVKQSVKVMQVAFSEKSPGQISSPDELYFNQLFIRNPQTGEKLFVENIGDLSFLHRIHTWWSGVLEPLATTVIAASFCDVPAEGFLRMGQQNFSMQECATLQSDKGYVPIWECAPRIDFTRLCSLHETYSYGEINAALLKKYPLDPSDAQTGSFIGYDPHAMPEYTIEMWAARLAQGNIRPWTRLTLLAPLLAEPSQEEHAPQEQVAVRDHEEQRLSPDSSPQSPERNSSLPADEPSFRGEERTNTVPNAPKKKYARTRHATFEAFAQNVKKAHRDSLPLLQEILRAFLARFSDGIEIEYQKSKVAVIIADNKSRVRNLVNLVPAKDGCVDMQSEPLGLELSLQSADDITTPHWQLLLSYFNEHSNVKAGSGHRVLEQILQRAAQRQGRTHEAGKRLSKEQARAITNTIGRELGRSIVRGVLRGLFQKGSK